MSHPHPRRNVRTLFPAAALAAAALAASLTAAAQAGPRPPAGALRATGARMVPNSKIQPRLQSMAFYEGENENTDLPASFMATNYQWTEQGVGPKTADAYHNAGGLHAMRYTDSNARNCSSNQPGTCKDALTLLNNLPEEAWLHEQSQPAVRVFGNGQQRNNPLDAVFQAAWTKQVQALMNPSSGGSTAYTAAEGGSMELDTYNWETIPTFTTLGGPQHEITQGSQVIAAEVATVMETPTYAVGNGVDYDYPLGGAYDQFLSAAGTSLIGMFNENAFAVTYGSGYMTNSYPVTNAWQNQQDGVLDVTGRSKYDFVWMEGNASPAHRLYGLASFWMSLNPTYSVLWEDFCAPDRTPQGLCNSTWDDAAVVPRNPLVSASTDITVLKVGSLFVREFAACYQGGASIGPCAAVVNPTTSSVAFPTLKQHYSRQIVLPTASLYGGGKVQWTSGVPSSLSAASAVIVAGTT